MAIIQDDIDKRIQEVNNVYDIDEFVSRDLLNFMLLQDTYAMQINSFAEAIKDAIEETDIDKNLKDAVSNSYAAIQYPDIVNKSLEVEARHFRKVCIIAFVRGIGSGKLHDVQWKGAPQHSIYDCAYGAANYVMRMYYDVQSDLKPTEPCPVVTVAFLDPSESMEDTTVLSRHRVTKKAALALMEWASQEDYLQHYTPAPASQDRTLFGRLTEDGKESLRKAIENADKTREAK